MITAVSIALYAVALCFAAILGVMAEMNEYGRINRFQGRLVIILTAFFFVLAAVLQVAS